MCLSTGEIRRCWLLHFTTSLIITELLIVKGVKLKCLPNCYLPLLYNLGWKINEFIQPKLYFCFELQNTGTSTKLVQILCSSNSLIMMSAFKEIIQKVVMNIIFEN